MGELLKLNHYLDDAKERGVPLGNRPNNRVVVTGLAARTALGDMNQTWQAFKENRSGIIDIGEHLNMYASQAGPLPESYDPIKALKSLYGKASD